MNCLVQPFHTTNAKIDVFIIGLNIQTDISCDALPFILIGNGVEKELKLLVRNGKFVTQICF